MNIKTTTIVVVAVMVLASIGAVALADQSQAADSPKDLGDVYVTETGVDKVFQVNEKEFAGYKYVLTWKVAYNGDATLITSTQETTGGIPNSNSKGDVALGDPGQFTLKMTQTEVGQYNLKVTTTANNNENIQVVLKCEIKVTINNVEKTLESIDYSMRLISLKTSGLTISLNNLDLTVGNLYGDKVGVSGLPRGVDDYYWYAVNLPSGITMSEGGYISGVPLKKESGTAKVVITDRGSGVVYNTTLGYSVSPGAESGYWFQVAINGVRQYANVTSYIVVQGDSVVLKTYEGKVGSGNLIDVMSVYVVNNEGSVASIEVDSGTTGQYTIPTNGTGAYRVVMNFGSETKDFMLFVSPSFEEISAGITITGGN